LYVLAYAYIRTYDNGSLTQAREVYVGANSFYLPEIGGHFTRSALLPLQSIVNPFGIFFDPRKLIVPSTFWGSVILTVQGLCSDVLLLMTVLSIRRRFKAE